MNTHWQQSTRLLSDVARAYTKSELYASAWRAALAYLAAAENTDGPTPPYRCLQVLSLHARQGPRHLRMSRLEVWRVIVDAMHYRAKGGAV